MTQSSRLYFALMVLLGPLSVGCRNQLLLGLPPVIETAPAPTCESTTGQSEYRATRLKRRRATQGWVLNLGKDGTSYAVKNVGPSGAEVVSAVNTPSGEMVLVGSTLAPTEVCEQPLLIVLGLDGRERMLSVLPLSGRLLSALPLGDGGFLVGGVTEKLERDSLPFGFIARLTASGEVSWSRVAQGLRGGVVAIRKQGERAVLVGVSSGDTWLIETDWNGNLVSLEPIAEFESRAQLLELGGTWLLFGLSQSFSSGARTLPAVVRLDADGKVIKRQYFRLGVTNYGTFDTAARLPNSEILAGGRLDDDMLNSACFTRLNARGEESWHGCLHASASITALMPMLSERAAVCLQTEIYDRELRMSVPASELQLVWFRNKKLAAFPLEMSGAKMTACNSITMLPNGNVVVLGAGQWLAMANEVPSQ